MAPLLLSSSDLLRAVTDLVLGRADAGPILFGARASDSAVRLHPVPLDPADPLADLRHLVAPSDWDLVVVTCDVSLRLPQRPVQRVRLAHGCNRAGDRYTTANPEVIGTTLRDGCGPLATACEQVLAEVAPRRSMGGHRS